MFICERKQTTFIIDKLVNFKNTCIARHPFCVWNPMFNIRKCSVKFEKQCSGGQEQKCETVTDTINEQQCQTQMERKCDTVTGLHLEIHQTNDIFLMTEEVCNVVTEQSCRQVNDQKCSVRLVQTAAPSITNTDPAGDL